MRILYICQRVPYPPNRGDKIASYNAIRFLAERHEVVVGCVASSEEERGYAEELRQQGFEVVLGSISGLGQKWNALRSLITGEPLSVGFFRSAELKNNLAEAVAGRGGYAIAAPAAFIEGRGGRGHHGDGEGEERGALRHCPCV